MRTESPRCGVDAWAGSSSPVARGDVALSRGGWRKLSGTVAGLSLFLCAVLGVVMAGFLLVHLLLACGDVESNPGPRKKTGERKVIRDCPCMSVCGVEVLACNLCVCVSMYTVFMKEVGFSQIIAHLMPVLTYCTLYVHAIRINVHCMRSP